MRLTRGENIARQEQIADQLAELQDRIENPQTEEELDENYRDAILITKRQLLFMELERIQKELREDD
ncbi:hypothetical protein N4G41_00310 [Kosakonia sacchari]|uniref:hypothetical protein n=1 Tax=Kosakonia sacchari TaxID=1158459 RepID=UPI002ACE152B|nr:hypothetical protein [Kosakonia sacchari]MDZ7320079.1 hypothetical protein [Kosakonia sacchari]